MLARFELWSTAEFWYRPDNYRGFDRKYINIEHMSVKNRYQCPLTIGNRNEQIVFFQMYSFVRWFQ